MDQSVHPCSLISSYVDRIHYINFHQTWLECNRNIFRYPVYKVCIKLFSSQWSLRNKAHTNCNTALDPHEHEMRIFIII